MVQNKKKLKIKLTISLKINPNIILKTSRTFLNVHYTNTHLDCLYECY